jgi:putative ABC transport system ATP-binding protein
MNLLHIQNVTKSFETGEGPLHVLRGVSLGLQSGKSLALTGESGSGKSTLLYLIGGLDAPDCGQIKILGRDIAHFDDPQRAALRKGTVGVVFQQFNLIPSLNVAANLSFHARLSGSEDRSWTMHLAKYLGLAPTGNLDEETADVVMNLLLELVQESGAGLLMVTHSRRLADRLDHHLHLQAGLVA